jgi:hypothetical protein
MAHHPAPSDDAVRHAHGEPYTPEEIERFHIDDRHAARAIVSLMLAVFSLGFIGSLTIAIVVAG